MSGEERTPILHKMDFLNWAEDLANQAGRETDVISGSFGEKLPATLTGLSSTLSLLYKVATCDWGCSHGSHQIEWLIARVVNHAMSSYRLARAGCYNESLVLTRGIGEIANLLQLFDDSSELSHWAQASRRDRLNSLAQEPSGIG